MTATATLLSRLLARPATLLLGGISLTSILACGTLPGTADVDVAECQGDADVDDVTFIAWDYEQSVHELITCGQLNMQLTQAVLTSFQTVIGDPSSLPEGWSYAEGVYTIEGVGVSMDIVFQYGPDSPIGQAGGAIAHDLFASESFLVNPVTSRDNDTYIVTYDEPGPLAALLGQGTNPPNPITLTPEALSAAQLIIGGLQAKAVIHLDDERTATITYHLESPEQLITSMLFGSQIDYDMIDASAVRDDLGQTMTTTVWDITYNNTLHGLMGDIEADVVGGPFDFHVAYAYSGGDPAVTITCLDAGTDSGI